MLRQSCLTTANNALKSAIQTKTIWYLQQAAFAKDAEAVSSASGLESVLIQNARYMGRKKNRESLVCCFPQLYQNMYESIKEAG